MSKVNVLIVDDEPELIVEVKKILENNDIKGWKLNVVTAENGAQALDLLLRDEFSLVIVDIQMPMLSGLEVIDKTRTSKGPNQTVPFIVLSGLIEQVAELNNEHAEGIQFIEKPFDKEKLLRVVTLSLAQHLSAA